MATYYRVNLKDKENNIIYPNVHNNWEFDENGNVILNRCDILAPEKVNKYVTTGHRTIEQFDEVNESFIGSVNSTVITPTKEYLAININYKNDASYKKGLIFVGALEDSLDAQIKYQYYNNDNRGTSFTIANLEQEQTISGAKTHTNHLYLNGTITNGTGSNTAKLIFGNKDNCYFCIRNSETALVISNTLNESNASITYNPGLGFFAPTEDRTLNLGDTSYKWTEAYLGKATIYDGAITMMGDNWSIVNKNNLGLVKWDGSRALFGTTSTPSIIRSSGNDLAHYRTDYNGEYLIFDTSNYSTYTVPKGGGEFTGTVHGRFVGKTFSIVVGGSSSYFYPVVIPISMDKQDLTRISVWKNLGSQTPSLSGNHSNGTSSMWAMFECRNRMWDGNQGGGRTIFLQQDYATLIAHANMLGSGVGNFAVWLRGGGCQYNITTTSLNEPIIYYSDTNLGTSSYPVNVGPISAVENGGYFASGSLSYDFNGSGVRIKSGNTLQVIASRGAISSQTSIYLPGISTFLTGSANDSTRNFYTMALSTWNSNYSSYANGTIGFCY